MRDGLRVLALSMHRLDQRIPASSPSRQNDRIPRVQQIGDLLDVRLAGPCRRDRVDQAAVSVHANVRLHAEMPRVALLGLVHFGVTLAFLVLRRIERRDDREIGRAHV